jgi:hypothetical protein
MKLLSLRSLLKPTLAAFLCASLRADTRTASITGTTADSSGGVLSDVAIAATDIDRA